MKKMIAILCAVLMLLLCGCETVQNANTETETVTVTETPTSDTSDVTPSPETSKTETSVITDPTTETPMTTDVTFLTETPVTTTPTVTHEESGTLSEAIAKTTRYAMTLKVTLDGETGDGEEYFYENGAMRFSYIDFFGGEYTDYIKFCEDEMLYYADYEDYYVVSSKSDCFWYIEYASFHGLESLDSSIFTEISEGVFSASEEYVNDCAKILLYDEDDEEYGTWEKFDSFVVYTNDKGVYKITLSSEYYDGEEKMPVSYELVFDVDASFDAIVLPNDAIEINDDNFSDLFGDDEWEYPTDTVPGGDDDDDYTGINPGEDL